MVFSIRHSHCHVLLMFGHRLNLNGSHDSFLWQLLGCRPDPRTAAFPSGAGKETGHLEISYLARLNLTA